MRFSHWFRRSYQPPQSFQPNVCLLEDRTAPAVFRVLIPPTPVIPPATHLHVIAPQEVESGKAFTVTVSAENASNQVVTGYTGTVQISLGTADAGATFPASFTFSATDKGKHTFQVTLKATGAQTVKSVSGALTGQAPVIVDAAVTHFGVYTVSQTMTGSPTQVNVVALDASNNIVAGYTGKVHFSSSDFYALLPADYTFTASDKGAHLFSVAFANPGKQTLSVTNITGAAVMGSTLVQVCPPWYYPVYGYNPYYSNWGYSGM